MQAPIPIAPAIGDERSRSFSSEGTHGSGYGSLSLVGRSRTWWSRGIRQRMPLRHKQIAFAGDRKFVRRTARDGLSQLARCSFVAGHTPVTIACSICVSESLYDSAAVWLAWPRFLFQRHGFNPPILLAW